MCHFLCDILGHGLQDQDLALWFVALDPGIGSMVLAIVSPAGRGSRICQSRLVFP